MPLVVFHGLDQSALGGQQVDKLPEPFVRPLGGDLAVVVLGQRAADPLEDFASHILAADVADRLPDGRHHQALVAGEQQHQRGVGGLVEVPRPAAAGQPLRAPFARTRPPATR